MAVFTIGDTHLSFGTDKPMDIFKGWTDYTDRLEKSWRAIVKDEDTVIIPGDISWALSLEEAESDLKFLDSLPGKKILGKGNHDFWWATMKKHDSFFEKHGINSISFLFNNAHVAENIIIAGTRGWYQDEGAQNAPSDADFLKLMNRETLRLKMSLDAAKAISETDEGYGKETIAFMHFPPFWNGKESEPIINLLLERGITRLYYGHIHGNYTIDPDFEYKGIKMSIISADYLGFIPKFIE